MFQAGTAMRLAATLELTKLTDFNLPQGQNYQNYPVARRTRGPEGTTQAEVQTERGRVAAPSPPVEGGGKTGRRTAERARDGADATGRPKGKTGGKKWAELGGRIYKNPNKNAIFSGEKVGRNGNGDTLDGRNCVFPKEITIFHF